MHGNIYEIELDKDYGYGYVQVVMTTELGLDNQLLLRILDYYSKTSYEGEVVLLEGIDELVSPSIMMVYPRTTGKNKWRLIGKGNIPTNYNVPKFKSDSTTKSWENRNWNDVSWYIISDLIANGLNGGYTYTQVKHLPFWRHCSSSVFKIKLTMYWLKKHCKKITDYINIEEDYNNGVIYNEVINSVFYSEIKKGIRNIPC